MTKAYLMNSARYVTGAGANDNLFSSNQGMGALDLGTAFDGTPRILRDELTADKFTASGQTRTIAGEIVGSIQTIPGDPGMDGCARVAQRAPHLTTILT